MVTSKVTSKGQITVPAEVRRALGIRTGDSLVFETKADYVVVRRQQSVWEIAEDLRRRFPLEPRRYASDEEAVAAYFQEDWPEDTGDELYVVRPGHSETIRTRR